MSEPESSQGERALSEREGAQRSRGATRAGRRAAPRGGAGMGMAPVGLSEERALSEWPASPLRVAALTRPGDGELLAAAVPAGGGR